LKKLCRFSDGSCHRPDRGRKDRLTYQGAYWKFFWRTLRNYLNNPAKLWMGSMILLAGHHFLLYAHEVANELAPVIRTPEDTVNSSVNNLLGDSTGI
jgi:hypothetical protein